MNQVILILGFTRGGPGCVPCISFWSSLFPADCGSYSFILITQSICGGAGGQQSGLSGRRFGRSRLAMFSSSVLYLRTTNQNPQPPEFSFIPMYWNTNDHVFHSSSFLIPRSILVWLSGQMQCLQHTILGPFAKILLPLFSLVFSFSLSQKKRKKKVVVLLSITSFPSLCLLPPSNFFFADFSSCSHIPNQDIPFCIRSSLKSFSMDCSENRVWCLVLH